MSNRIEQRKSKSAARNPRGDAQRLDVFDFPARGDLVPATSDLAFLVAFDELPRSQP
jgi:hypothetical protein